VALKARLGARDKFKERQAMKRATALRIIGLLAVSQAPAAFAWGAYHGGFGGANDHGAYHGAGYTPYGY